MTTTPTDTQIADGFEEAANGLEKAIPLACTCKVDMELGVAYSLSKDSECGTPACHGGWLAFAASKGCFPSFRWEEDFALIYTRGSQVLHWLCGWRHWGTEFDQNPLPKWAKENPRLWGNEWGEKMFGLSNAPFNDDKIHLTIKDIIAHYRGVVERLRARAATQDRKEEQA